MPKPKIGIDMEVLPTTHKAILRDEIKLSVLWPVAAWINRK